MKSLRCLLLLVGAAVLLQAEAPSNYHVSVEVKLINQESGGLLYGRFEPKTFGRDDDSEAVGDGNSLSVDARIFILVAVFSIAYITGICTFAYCTLKRSSPDGKVRKMDMFKFFFSDT